MTKAKYPSHDLTMMALTRNADGTLSVYDIVETSFHYAAWFYNRFRRNPEVHALMVCAPGAATGRRVQFAREGR